MKIELTIKFMPKICQKPEFVSKIMPRFYQACQDYARIMLKNKSCQ